MASSSGVGTIRFDLDGDVIGCERNLGGTTRNCGGGVPFRDCMTRFASWMLGIGSLYSIQS